MIHVNRKIILVPDCLRQDIDSNGKRETEAAEKYFAQRSVLRALGMTEKQIDEKEVKDKVAKGQKGKAGFSFTAYSDKDVKEALVGMFRGKCGYCEIGYGGSARDIEHYRPKGRIDYYEGGQLKSHVEGYYWLAAQWDNLILSCRHCNTGEYHVHLMQDNATSDLRKSGKGNFFPLADEKKRAKCDKDIPDEEPLLLDPCNDKPSEHLFFRTDGIVIANYVDGKPSVRGKTSIRIYGLRRLPLVEMRAERARLLSFALTCLGRLINEYRVTPNAICKGKVLMALKKFREEFLEHGKPFLGLCYQLVRESPVYADAVEIIKRKVNP
jgi:hypothetical protein